MGKVYPSFKNITSSINYMYSDGPEDISGTNVPCTLLAYREYDDSSKKTSTELNLPQHIDLAAYHNNYSGDNLYFGFLIRNTKSTSVKVSIKSFTKISSPGSTPAETMKTKVTNNAKVEEVFANYDGFDQDEKITISGKGYALVYVSEKVKAQQTINTRMRIRTLSGNATMYGRFICFRLLSDGTIPSAEALWELVNTNYPKGLGGQFTGIVNYLEKSVNATVTNEGDYFTLFNTASYANGGADGKEFDKVLYHKPDGKTIFAGNYGVIYKVKLNHPKKSGYVLKISPFSEADNPQTAEEKLVAQNNFAFTLVKKLEGDLEFESFNNNVPLMRNNDFDTKTNKWKKTYNISLSSTAYDEFELVLPAANCGVIHCEYAKA